MIATSHVVIGATVGVTVGTITQNPAAALTAGIISHFICDSIPHLDAPFKIELMGLQKDKVVWSNKLLAWAIADSLLAFVLTLFLWMKHSQLSFTSTLAWGAFGAYLPDLLDNFPLWSQQIRTLPGFKQFHKLHLATHNLWRFKFPMPDSWFLGTVTQILFVVPCLIYLLT